MNNGESNDVNTLLNWIIGCRAGRPVTDDQAREAAVRLAGRARKTLAAGLTPDDVRAAWPTRPSHPGDGR